MRKPIFVLCVIASALTPMISTITIVAIVLVSVIAVEIVSNLTLHLITYHFAIWDIMKYFPLLRVL